MVTNRTPIANVNEVAVIARPNSAVPEIAAAMVPGPAISGPLSHAELFRASPDPASATGAVVSNIRPIVGTNPMRRKLEQAIRRAHYRTIPLTNALIGSILYNIFVNGNVATASLADSEYDIGIFEA